MINKLFLTTLALLSPLSAVGSQSFSTASAYDYIDFDTYQTVDKYLEDFDYLTENSYRVSYSNVDYVTRTYKFYVFPIHYDLDIVGNMFLYYSNEFYQIYTNHSFYEITITTDVLNYIGTETSFTYLALDYMGMSQLIEHDKTEKTDHIAIYSSFYKFFTGFFPENVVVEYEGIFTFVIVSFLLFLVFGFVFFLFRVIRRLVGFK